MAMPGRRGVKRVFEISTVSGILIFVDKTKESLPDDLPFEEALSRLESIVESLEQGDVPLADLLTKYGEGNRLLRICGQRLRDAELKIEMLKNSGQAETMAPFDPDDS